MKTFSSQDELSGDNISMESPRNSNVSQTSKVEEINDAIKSDSIKKIKISPVEDIAEGLNNSTKNKNSESDTVVDMNENVGHEKENSDPKNITTACSEDESFTAPIDETKNIEALEISQLKTPISEIAQHGESDPKLNKHSALETLLIQLQETTDTKTLNLTRNLKDLLKSARDPGASVRVLSKIVTNIRMNPGNNKYCRIKSSNLKFIRNTEGCLNDALEFLKHVGFTTVENGDQLTYTRNDPGLLWLASSLLEAATTDVSLS